MLWRRAVVILRTGTADKSVLSGVPDIDLLLLIPEYSFLPLRDILEHC